VLDGSIGLKALEIVTTNVVVVAKAHNPTILSPAFLREERIVPSDWQPVDAQVITTLPIAKVPYTNGIELLVQPNRLQVLDHLIPPNEVEATPIPGIAKRFVETLKHVPYTSVGINFTGLIPMDAPEKFLIGRFLKDGPWNADDLIPKAVDFQFLYEHQVGRMKFSIAPGMVQRNADTELRGLIVEVNVHNDFPEDGRTQSALQCIGRYDECLKAVRQVGAQIIES